MNQTFKPSPEYIARIRAQFRLPPSLTSVNQDRVIPNVKEVERITKGFEPIPFDQWPSWTKAVALLKSDEDKGIGDTIHRQSGLLGKGFKWAMVKLGVPCGCDARQDQWNIEYPYALIPRQTHPDSPAVP